MNVQEKNLEFPDLKHNVQEKFKKNVSTYVILNFFTKIFSVLLWLFLAAILLPSEIGKYNIALSIIQIISVGCIFGTDAGVLRFYHIEKPSVVFSNIVPLFLIVSFPVVFMFLFLSKYLVFFLTPSFVEILSNYTYIIILAVAIFSNSITNVASAHFTALGRSFEYAKFNISQSFIFIAGSITAVYLGYGFLGLIFAKMLSTLLPVSYFFLSRELKNISKNFVSKRLIRDILKYTFPLMLGTLVGVFVSYWGRFLLDQYTNQTTLGVYSFFLMFALNIHFVWHSFNQAWTPKIFFELSHDREKAFNDTKTVIFSFSFLYLIGLSILIFVGDLFLFPLIFKKDYLMNLNVFYILLLAPLFSGFSVITYPLIYYPNETRKIMIISMFSSLIMIFVTIFFVKLLNQNGAGLSYLIMTIFGLSLYLFVFRKIVGIPPIILNWVLFLSGIMLINVLFLLLVSSIYLFVAILLLGAIISYRKGNLSTNLCYIKNVVFNKIRNRLL